MEDELKVSKDLLKTITVDTRVKILKALEERRMTASELSRLLKKHVTTISEHLEILRKSNLVERIERPGRKWVYYKLTREGKKVLHPESYRWIAILALSFLIFSSLYFVMTVDAYPGQMFYGIKRAREKFLLALIRGNVERARKHLELAEERLKEAKWLASEGKVKELKETLREYENELREARREIEVARKKKKVVTSLLEQLSESTPKHISILQNILVKTGRKREVLEALNESFETYEASIEELRNLTKRPYAPLFKQV